MTKLSEKSIDVVEPPLREIAFAQKVMSSILIGEKIAIEPNRTQHQVFAFDQEFQSLRRYIIHLWPLTMADENYKVGFGPKPDDPETEILYMSRSYI